MTAASGPTLLLHGRAVGWFEMYTEHVQSALRHAAGHALEVTSRLSFGRQMSETVDHVERGIELRLHFEVGHVADDHRLRKIVSSQSDVAEINCLGIQVIPANLIARLPQLDQQSSGAACRFEDPADLAACMFGKARFQKSKLRRRINLPMRMNFGCRTVPS